MARITPETAGGPNVCAFLDMIAWSEIGPALLAVSDDGYNVIVGSTAKKPHLFASYADHPQIFVSLSPSLRSSAAGRYQFLARTWDALAGQLTLPDFCPASQDLGAIELIRECHALQNVQSGQIDQAIGQCNRIWASLTGSPYGQGTNSLANLLGAYNAALSRYAP